MKHSVVVFHRGDERRESPRCELITIVEDPHGKYEMCTSVLGIAGCYCCMSEPPVPGTLVQVCAKLPGSDTEILLHGRVVRLEPTEFCTGVVVRFENLPFDTERTIARWLDLLSGTFPLAMLA